MTRDLTATVDAYFAMWNEENTAKHARHIEKAWTDSGHYVDPTRDATGHAALNEMVSAARPHSRATRWSGQVASTPTTTRSASRGTSWAPTAGPCRWHRRRSPRSGRSPRADHRLLRRTRSGGCRL